MTVLLEFRSWICGVNSTFWYSIVCLSFARMRNARVDNGHPVPSKTLLIFRMLIPSYYYTWGIPKDRYYIGKILPVHGIQSERTMKKVKQNQTVFTSSALSALLEMNSNIFWSSQRISSTGPSSRHFFSSVRAFALDILMDSSSCSFSFQLIFTSQCSAGELTRLNAPQSNLIPGVSPCESEFGLHRCFFSKCWSQCERDRAIGTSSGRRRKWVRILPPLAVVVSPRRQQNRRRKKARKSCWQESSDDSRRSPSEADNGINPSCSRNLQTRAFSKVINCSTPAEPFEYERASLKACMQMTLWTSGKRERQGRSQRLLESVL
jgi:hypothetical protein